MAVNKIFRIPPLFRENLNVALRSVRSNRLRSVLTILIIGVGITSLVGVLTATDALKHQISSQFEQMGATSFSIRSRYFSDPAPGRERIKNKRNISYSQAMAFREQFDMPALVSVFCRKENVTAKSGGESTNPDIGLVAADEHYLMYNNTSVAAGRGLLESDIRSGAFVCVIGDGVRRVLFRNEDPLDKIVSVGAVRYRVIGVTERMGGVMGGGADKEIVIPVTNARSYFIDENSYFTIGVVPRSGGSLEPFYERAEQLFRFIRRLSPIDASDFRINRNETLMENLREMMGKVTAAAVIIGLITLLGAAVGLMNIMLVSVKERTREIGTRKAIGASSRRIKQQFLLEAVVISQLGCLAGIVLGTLAGNVTARLIKAPFIFPGGWMLFAMGICVLVGIASGYLPAVRASRLDPIEALRYE